MHGVGAFRFDTDDFAARLQELECPACTAGQATPTNREDDGVEPQRLSGELQAQ